MNDVTIKRDVATEEEASELVKQRRIIKTRELGVVEYYGAWMVIWEKRLYRFTHDSFEDYCRDEGGLGLSAVKKMLQAAIVRRGLLGDGESFPMGQVAQGQALVASVSDEAMRELGKETPETRGEVMTNFGESGVVKVTKANVKEEVARVKHKKVPKPVVVDVASVVVLEGSVAATSVGTVGGEVGSAAVVVPESAPPVAASSGLEEKIGFAREWAVVMLYQVYERNKVKLNCVPPMAPVAIFKMIKNGMMEDSLGPVVAEKPVEKKSGTGVGDGKGSGLAGYGDAPVQLSAYIG